MKLNLWLITLLKIRNAYSMPQMCDLVITNGVIHSQKSMHSALERTGLRKERDTEILVIGK